MDPLQTRLLPDLGTRPAEGEEVPLGPPSPPQLGPQGARGQDREEPGGVKKYVRQRLDIPAKEKTLPIAEQTGGEKMFETLKAKMLKPEKRQVYENSWIRSEGGKESQRLVADS